MSKQSKRTFALAVLISSLSLLAAACGEGDRGAGSGGGDSGTNATPSSNSATAGTASSPGSKDTAKSAEPRQIEMGDDVFMPAQLTIPAGTRVTWVNKGKKAHTVVSSDKLFDSGLVQVGGEFSYKFDTPGTYAIRCSPHPKMMGRIVVE
jgi:plastocyanin